MSKLYHYFLGDFKNFRGIELTRQPEVVATVGDGRVSYIERIIIQMDTSTRLLTFYIPESGITAMCCHAILENLNDSYVFSEGLANLRLNSMGEVKVGNPKTGYSNHIYIYTEKELPLEETINFEAIAQQKNIFLTLRSQKYLMSRIESSKPQAFISHDSRDKKLIANPLFEGLNQRLCTVWYDDFSLEVGESLRASIERGIKEAKKCVIILTPNFLTNPGWTKTEFDSIFTRERLFTERIVLPIWYGVTKEEIYDYSPSLLDVVALKWPSPEIPKDIYVKETEILISKIHSKIIE